MERLGARRDGIAAVVGPCIAQASYEVGDGSARCGGADAGWRRLPVRTGPAGPTGSSIWPAIAWLRLRQAGVAAASLGVDTCRDEARFFSHRRRTLAGGGPIGHQIAAIVL